MPTISHPVDRYTCETIHKGIERRLDDHQERIDKDEDLIQKLSDLIIRMQAIQEMQLSQKKKWWEGKWFDRLVTVLLILFVVIVLTAIGKDMLLDQVMKLGGMG
jgi:hypothetical protein